MVSACDTPNGFIFSDRMHYYVKDYQGNVRQVTDADGVVKQDNHYYPYGMLMGESSNILASARGYKSVSFNPYLFGSKEYLTTGSANLLDFTARTYDPTTLLFLTPDPQATNYTSLNSYLYCGSNPINRVDPSGMECHSFQEDSTMQKFANNYPDDNVINIASHGNSNLLSYKKDNEDFKIKTADKLIEEINKLFKLAQGDVLKLEFIEIRLFACYSGTDDESSGKSLAQIFSEGFPNAVIYGADDKLGLKADGTYVNMSEKKTYWRAFHKGKEISLSEIGNIKQRLHYDKLLLLTPQLNNFKDSLSKAKPKL